MNAFRTSLPGRIISLSIAFALASGGIISIFGLRATVWLPWSLLIPIGGCIIGIVLAIEKYAGAAMALVLALPLLLWPYVMLLMIITDSYPQLGWLLVGAGGGVTAFSAVGMRRPSLALPASRRQQAA